MPTIHTNASSLPESLLDTNDNRSSRPGSSFNYNNVRIKRVSKSARLSQATINVNIDKLQWIEYLLIRSIDARHSPERSYK